MNNLLKLKVLLFAAFSMACIQAGGQGEDSSKTPLGKRSNTEREEVKSNKTDGTNLSVGKPSQSVKGLFAKIEEQNKKNSVAELENHPGNNIGSSSAADEMNSVSEQHKETQEFQLFILKNTTYLNPELIPKKDINDAEDGSTNKCHKALDFQLECSISQNQLLQNKITGGGFWAKNQLSAAQTKPKIFLKKITKTIKKP